MERLFKRNCCDGLYNSFDIHFTSACDNKCAHCIDSKYQGIGIIKPDVAAISKTIIDNKVGYDDVLFLGGEPCLYLEEMLDCINLIKRSTDLKVFVTTSMPKTCYDKYDLFKEILNTIDGLNISAQSHNENVADMIRGTISQYDRQKFYCNLPCKDKIRINLNIVKPYLYTKKDITECLMHYDRLGFNSIKLSEIQHGEEHFVSFEKTFGLNFGSPYFSGCQTYVDTTNIIPSMKTPLLLKRSCFMCEDSLKASLMDGVKIIHHLFNKPTNKYGVVYSNGVLSKFWR